MPDIESRPDLDALRTAVAKLPTHTRRNGFATPRLWVDRRDVLRLIDRAALAATPEPTLDDALAATGQACADHVRLGFVYSVIGCPRCYPALADAVNAAVKESAEDLTIAFRRFCVGRFGVAPTVEELRGVLDEAARLHERTEP